MRFINRDSGKSISVPYRDACEIKPVETKECCQGRVACLWFASKETIRITKVELKYDLGT